MDCLTAMVLQKLQELRTATELVSYAHGIGCGCQLCQECIGISEIATDADNVLREVMTRHATICLHR